MTIRRCKLSVIGAGLTGANTALMLAEKELGDVVLLDIPPLYRPTRGKSLDMLQAGPVIGFDTRIQGTSDYTDTAGSDVVILTAGIARRPGMTRSDLIPVNARIVRDVCRQVRATSPEAIVLVLTNPVDAMTCVAYETLGFPKNRVLGQSGVLDTSRLRTFIAQELNVSVEDVHALVLGGHGDDMVPLTRYTDVGGLPIAQLIPADRLAAIVERTRNGGGEIVELLGSGSAFCAPAAALVQMTEAIVRDKKRVLPAVVRLEGEYGYRDLFLGVPARLGASGVEQVYELRLTAEERAALDRSADSVRAATRLACGVPAWD